MKIRVGQVFRVEHPGQRETSQHPNLDNSYYELTRGSHGVGADINKGIWAYKAVRIAEAPFLRRPAVLLHSNPFKEDSLDVPWIDVIDPDNGYVIYNGDNRKPGPPLEARGNALMESLARCYRDPQSRINAPPIIVFTQHMANGNRRGFRQFSGYGVPTRYILQTQSQKGSIGHFTNLVLEIALFSLDNENGWFDWAWIDARRDGTKTDKETLRLAPSAWKLWVAQGEDALERCRRKVSTNRVTSTRNQSPSSEDQQLLEKIVAHYCSNRWSFEGLAALIAKRVIGDKCMRGWVTKRSGDGGIDFVCRFDVGTGFGSTSMVVLGQAKCIEPHRSVSGKDLARVAARLRRGWFGVLVTTGMFSEASQEEVYSDQYPILLINGKQVAREIRLIMNNENIELGELLAREQQWYSTHTELIDPSRIIEQTLFGSQLDA